MNRFNLINKTRRDLVYNKSDFNIIIKYLEDNLGEKYQKELLSLSNIANSKEKEAHNILMKLEDIDKKINDMDMQYSNYKTAILNLFLAIILLFGASIFFLNTIFNYLVLIGADSFWKSIITIVVGFVNFYLAKLTYHDIRYKNETFNNYKNQQKQLKNEFVSEYRNILEKILWFEVSGDHVLKTAKLIIEKTEYQNDANISIVNENNQVDYGCNENEKVFTLIKQNKKR